MGEDLEDDEREDDQEKRRVTEDRLPSGLMSPDYCERQEALIFEEIAEDVDAQQWRCVACKAGVRIGRTNCRFCGYTPDRGGMAAALAARERLDPLGRW